MTRAGSFAPVSVEIRPATPADVDACARICHDAFNGIAQRHGFTPDFPSPEFAETVIAGLVEHASVFGVVAESDGRIVGSNFLDERDAVRGVGPISVDPSAQGLGIGRRLMEAVIERGREARSVRLLQDAFNTVSFSLYASLGFDAREPIALLRGLPRARTSGEVAVRRMKEADIEECGELCRRIHGFDRNTTLRELLWGSHYVAGRDGRISAYVSAATIWPVSHAVAESEADMRELLLGAAELESQPISFLLPTRQASLLRWGLAEGLEVVKPMTLMSIGAYQDPGGSWFPSVLY
jgi:predicted N-acetyltransferase YhbS